MPTQTPTNSAITTYGADDYVHTEQFALSSRKDELKANQDGSYTVHFNCGEQAINNIDVEQGWTGIHRMYQPSSDEQIVDNAKGVQQPHS